MSENIEKRIKSRSIQKHDLEVNWNKATSFVPYKGEFIIYDIEVDKEGNNITQLNENGEEKTVYELVGRTTPYTYERIKLGDGKTLISNLPFIDNTSLKYIEQEFTETQKAQARTNIGAQAEISSANISYEDGGGYVIDSLAAYNQVESDKLKLPVTIADIKEMLNNFPLNLSSMQQVMVQSSYYSKEAGYLGILPIPYKSTLQEDFTDLPLFETAPEYYSIAVRSSNGALQVGTPKVDADATNKKYVDNAISTLNNKIIAERKQIINYDVTHVESTCDGTFSADVLDTENNKYCFELPLFTLSQETEVTFTISDEVFNSLAANSMYDATSGCEMIFISTDSYRNSGFPEDPDCLAYCIATNMSSGNISGDGCWHLANQTITLTGTEFYIHICETNYGIAPVDQESFISDRDVTLNYEYSIYDDSNKGPIHTTDLESDKEIHYNYPIEELTIASLVSKYSGYAEEWTVSFIAGDSEPIVTTPLETNETPIKWLYAEPVFEANKKYLITFKKIIDTIYGIWTVLE